MISLFFCFAREEGKEGKGTFKFQAEKSQGEAQIREEETKRDKNQQKTPKFRHIIEYTTVIVTRWVCLFSILSDKLQLQTFSFISISEFVSCLSLVFQESEERA